MMKSSAALFVCFLLLFSAALAAQEGAAPKAADSKKNTASHSPSTAAKTQFMRETGYRNGRPGYVVAYRKPLACGGSNDTGNLLWLTIAEAKAEEETERKSRQVFR